MQTARPMRLRMYLARRGTRDDWQACFLPGHHAALDIHSGAKAGPFKQFERLRRAVAGTTNQRHRPIFVADDFVQTLLQLTQRNQNTARRMPLRVFMGFTHIEQQRTAALQCRALFNINGWQRGAGRRKREQAARQQQLGSIEFHHDFYPLKITSITRWAVHAEQLW